MIQIQSVNAFIADTRISSKYQTVIPARVRKALGLKEGSKIYWQLLRLNNKVKVIAEPKPTNWAAYTRGLGKNTWKNIDIDNYIKNLRREWEKRS